MDKMSTNLPVRVDRTNWLSNFKKYINRILYSRKDSEVINKCANIDEYDVLSFEAFKFITQSIASKKDKSTVIMADINDLYQANKNRGKKGVNDLIKNLINDIKSNVEADQNPGYKIGKMGDEIYVYIPDKDIGENAELIERLKGVSSEELSISVGACDNCKKDITTALDTADTLMESNKKAYKTNKIKQTFGDDISVMSKHVVERLIEKLRININQLEESNKDDLKNTFNRALKDINPNTLINRLIKEMGKPTNNGNKNEQYDNARLRYQNEAINLYGQDASQELIDNYILSHIIAYHPVEGVSNSRYFRKLGHKETQGYIKKDFDMLFINLSGLKTINDTEGHEAGDAAINKSLEYLKSTLSSMGITQYSDIIFNGGGNSYTFLKKLTDEQRQTLTEKLSDFSKTKESKGILAIDSIIRTTNKNKLREEAQKSTDKNTFINFLDKELQRSDEEFDKKGIDRKIKDVGSMKSMIERMCLQLIRSKDANMIYDINDKDYEEIISSLRDGLENVLQNNKNKAESIDKDMTVEKEVIGKDNKDGKYKVGMQPTL